MLSRIVLNIVTVNVILILILMCATVAVSHLPSPNYQAKARDTCNSVSLIFS